MERVSNKTYSAIFKEVAQRYMVRHNPALTIKANKSELLNGEERTTFNVLKELTLPFLLDQSSYPKNLQSFSVDDVTHAISYVLCSNGLQQLPEGYLVLTDMLVNKSSTVQQMVLNKAFNKYVVLAFNKDEINDKTQNILEILITDLQIMVDEIKQNVLASYSDHISCRIPNLQYLVDLIRGLDNLKLPILTDDQKLKLAQVVSNEQFEHIYEEISSDLRKFQMNQAKYTDNMPIGRKSVICSNMREIALKYNEICQSMQENIQVFLMPHNTEVLAQWNETPLAKAVTKIADFNEALNDLVEDYTQHTLNFGF
jgi:hypothetical protein